MILKRTIIAASDPGTGLSVKQAETSIGDFFTRKLAVNNSYFRSEKERILFDKPLLSSFVQTHHIHYDKKKRMWRMNGIEGDDLLEQAMAHAEDNNRIFIAYKQLTQEQWSKLDWAKAESMFLHLARRGVPVVPYPMPLDGTLKEWRERKKIALQSLNKSQELLPVLCLYHDPEKALPIFQSEFKESKLLGVHYFNIKEPSVVTNLSALQELELRLTIGTEVPLIIGFCPTSRYLSNLAGASTAYILTLFGIDVVSYRVLSPEQIYYIKKLGPQEYKYYDTNEGGYNDSSIQVVWYGRELTRTMLADISVDEGLDPYQANHWADFLKESEDLDLLNNAVINRQSKKAIMDKSRWHTVAIELLPKKGF